MKDDLLSFDEWLDVNMSEELESDLTSIFTLDSHIELVRLYSKYVKSKYNRLIIDRDLWRDMYYES